MVQENGVPNGFVNGPVDAVGGAFSHDTALVERIAGRTTNTLSESVVYRVRVVRVIRRQSLSFSRLRVATLGDHRAAVVHQ